MSRKAFDIKTPSLAKLAISNILEMRPNAVAVRRVSQSSCTVVTYEMPEANAKQLWWLAATNSQLLIDEKIKSVQIESGPKLWLHRLQSDECRSKSSGEGQGVLLWLLYAYMYCSRN